MQSELESAKQAADQAKAQATELAKRAASLNSELEKANAQRNELQTKLDQATSEITSAQSQLELENTKQAADQSKAQATGLAKRAASLNSEIEKANAQGYVVDPGNTSSQSDLAGSPGTSRVLGRNWGRWLLVLLPMHSWSPSRFRPYSAWRLSIAGP